MLLALWRAIKYAKGSRKIVKYKIITKKKENFRLKERTERIVLNSNLKIT